MWHPSPSFTYSRGELMRNSCCGYAIIRKHTHAYKKKHSHAAHPFSKKELNPTIQIIHLFVFDDFTLIIIAIIACTISKKQMRSSSSSSDGVCAVFFFRLEPNQKRVALAHGEKLREKLGENSEKIQRKFKSNARAHNKHKYTK